MTRMFPFITVTWNPLGGACPHECSYCWARAITNRNKFMKYQGEPRIIEKELKRKFKPKDFVFAQDMTDLMANAVPSELIWRVLGAIKNNGQSRFLTLTKNPRRLLEFRDAINATPNLTLGATIETDLCLPSYPQISKAPNPYLRIVEMVNLRHQIKNPFCISIEPILIFGIVKEFADMIRRMNPELVAVGYDNYNHNLPEPSLETTEQLISELEKFTTVYRKTIRKAWWEP
jgi:protein gp37